MPGPAAAAQAAATAQLQGGSGSVAAIPQFIRADFAAATKDVLYGMGIVMAVAAVVAILGLKRGVQQAAAPETATALRRPTSAGSPTYHDRHAGCGSLHHDAPSPAGSFAALSSSR